MHTLTYTRQNLWDHLGFFYLLPTKHSKPVHSKPRMPQIHMIYYICPTLPSLGSMIVPGHSALVSAFYQLILQAQPALAFQRLLRLSHPEMKKPSQPEQTLSVSCNALCELPALSSHHHVIFFLACHMCWPFLTCYRFKASLMTIYPSVLSLNLTSAEWPLITWLVIHLFNDWLTHSCQAQN